MELAGRFQAPATLTPLNQDAINKAAAVWQRLEECLAVAFGEDSRVEEDDQAVIAATTDQAPEALLQFDDRQGKLVIQKGVATLRRDRFHASLGDGIVGDGERQLCDDHVGQRFALDIDAVPEAIDAKKHGVHGPKKPNGSAVTR